MNDRKDQKLERWLSVDLRLDFLKLCDIKTSELQEPIAAFQTNIYHACHLSTFPFQMVSLGGRLILEKVPEETRSDVLPTRTVSLNDFISFVSPHSIKTFDILMSSQLVLSWTAFETLAGDLWETAINTHLETLVSKSWEGKQVPFCLIRESDFNLKNKMGTILKRHLGMPSYDEIVKEYQRTFKDGNAGSDLFWNRDAIKLPYSLRNLIVHRAWKVDDKFRGEWKTSPWPIVCDEQGCFLLNGEMLVGLINGLFSSAKDLIKSVDSFITRHTKSAADCAG